MTRTIRHSFFFPHPKKIVWEYLTDPDLLSIWLMPSDFKLELGYKFIFGTKPKINLGFDGRIYCQVTEIVPLEKLSYTWRGGNDQDTHKLDSLVTWILVAKEGGTELILEHSGFTGLKNYFSYLIMNKGWSKIGKRFISRIQPGNV